MHVRRTTPDTTARIEGVEQGASVSIVLSRNEPGEGTRLHRHPYDETWVVQRGNVTFQSGDAVLHAGPGDVVTVPAGTPHRFTNDGPGRSELICIHPSATIIDEHLD